MVPAVAAPAVATRAARVATFSMVVVSRELRWVGVVPGVVGIVCM